MDEREADDDMHRKLVGDRGEFGMPTIGGHFDKRPGGNIDMDMAPGNVFEYREPKPVILWPTLKFSDREMNVDYGNQGYSVPIVTEDARYIAQILPDILQTFFDKNMKYSEVERAHDLGAKGIIPDINRKFAVLVSRIWHGRPSGSGESTEEVIGDMIGHLLLMLAKRRRS